jgi:ribosomal protein S18 acetylase RimI-like enzyme
LNNVCLRKFKVKDVDFAYNMTATEDWNVTRNDIVRVFDFEPQGCFVADVDGKAAGHVFAVAYGSLGWIGLLIVKSDYRRRGIGSILMKKAMEYLLAQQVKTIKLDAVPEIARLYRKLGFSDEYDSLRFAGTNEHANVSSISSARKVELKMIPDIVRFDARYFGAERARVLGTLFAENPGLSFVSYTGSNVTGYITCRKAEVGYNLGPWVCKPNKLQVAEELLLACLGKVKSSERIHVGLPSPNEHAVKLLIKHGFHQHSKSIRMNFGRKAAEEPEGIFAIAGAMKG